mgnify:CR=1 FL=1
MALAVVIVPASIAMADGHTAASESETHAIAPSVDLSGRWSGPRFGYGKTAEEKACGEAPCRLTFDIARCQSGWCGVLVSDGDRCGPTALILAAAEPHPLNFTGTLNLAEGSAAYVIRAAYRTGTAMHGEAGEATAATQARLAIVGDTGTELIMMRRSFPLHAELTRSGNAHCTPDKPTS